MILSGHITQSMWHRLAVVVCNAASHNNVKELGLWHAAGVDLNIARYDGFTPLHCVCIASTIDVATAYVVAGGAGPEPNSAAVPAGCAGHQQGGLPCDGDVHAINRFG